MKNIKEYVQTFLSFTTFIEDLAPFAKSNIIGPSWLEARFPIETPSAQAELVKIWYAFLAGDIIFTSTLDQDI